MNTASSSSAMTLTDGECTSVRPEQLSTSLTLRSPSRRRSSEISKAYGHASQLFLTRRFPEALTVLEPVVTPVKSEIGDDESAAESPAEALVVKATTTQRIKVWALYISLLNFIVDLGYDEGTRLFGQTKYSQIVSSVCNGDIWEKVVREGYKGNEGSVDAEVVYNLATLLLKQAQSQAVNQYRLESYLSSSPDMHLLSNSRRNQADSNRRQYDVHNANTPKDLESRIKILELFTLHVLPKSEEWDYAKSCLSNSDMLDEERREKFLQTLQELKDIQVIEEREREEQKLAEDEKVEVEARQLKETALNRVSTRLNDSAHRRKSSEVDYGIEQEPPSRHTQERSRAQLRHEEANPASAPAAARSRFSPPGESSRHHKVRRPTQKQPRSYIKQVMDLYRGLHNLVRNMMTTAEASPAMLLKVLVFVLAIIMAFSRGEVRERSRQILRNGWDAARRTVGMGVKVSYM